MPLNIIYFFFLVVQIVFALYMLIPLFSLAGYGWVNLFKIRTPFEKKPFLTDKQYEFGIIITAHQEIKFVVPLVDSILKQNYPHFYIYIVADDCDTRAIHFNDSRVMVLKPEQPLNAKIRSIHYGLDHFIKKHDVLIIFDADNLIHPSFLSVMNSHFQKGYQVVQADFKPKNTDSVYARMDAIGDIFNFFIEREMRMRLNLSATIWGSGVAMQRNLYEEVEYKDMLGGFDKKLQSHLLQQVDRIGFAPDAILYDEKISSGKSLENQRTRWISAYFKYFKESVGIFLQGIKRMNFNLIYFGFILLRPPLFIVLGISFVITVTNYFVSYPYFLVWLGIFLSFVLSFTAIVAIKSKDIRFVRTIFMMPVFVFRQMLALLKLGKAKKSFMKTEHTKLLFIDDLIKK